MLADTLRRIIDQKLTTAREVGELTGAAPSTVYRWMSGQSEPTYTSVRLLIRMLPNPKAQQELLSSLTAGTQWVTYSFDSDPDVNGDGRIDANDAMDASCKMVLRAAESLKEVRETCRDGELTQQECSDAISRLDEVIRASSLAQQILIEVSESHARKLKLTH